MLQPDAYNQKNLTWRISCWQFWPRNCVPEFLRVVTWRPCLLLLAGAAPSICGQKDIHHGKDQNRLLKEWGGINRVQEDVFSFLS